MLPALFAITGDAGAGIGALTENLEAAKPAMKPESTPPAIQNQRNWLTPQSLFISIAFTDPPRRELSWKMKPEALLNVDIILRNALPKFP